MNAASPVRPFLRRAGVLTLAALVVNLLLLLAGSTAGASMTVPPSTVVGVTPVTIATVLSLAVGFAIAAVLVARRATTWVRRYQVVGGVLALVSVASPLILDTDAATKAVLVAMHLVCGAAFVLALQPHASRAQRADDAATSPARA